MGVLYVVTAEVAPAAVEDFLAWHGQHHVQEVLAQPGFLRCTRWRDTELTQDGWVKIHSHYELSGRAAFEHYTHGEAAARLRQDGLEKFGTTARFRRALYDGSGEWSSSESG